MVPASGGFIANPMRSLVGGQFFCAIAEKFPESRRARSGKAQMGSSTNSGSVRDGAPLTGCHLNVCKAHLMAALTEISMEAN